MSTSHSAKVAAFRKLHESGCFAIPNPFDPGSARYLEHLGFKAVASTSAGFAWSIAKADNQITLGEILTHLTLLAQTVSIPVNADFEGGFADDADGVARNVTLATQTGVAGLSIEDSTGKADAPLYDFDLAVARIKAARAAIDKSGTGVLLTGRSEGFLVGRPDLAETIRRLQAYAAAGADCLYAPGIRTKEDIAAIVKAVAPKPVNVLAPGSLFTVAELGALGVRRVSVGGGLARAAWGGFIQAAKEMAESGSFEAFNRAAPGGELNKLFRR